MIKVVNFKKALILILFLSAVSGTLIVWQSRLVKTNFIVFSRPAISVNRLPVDSSIVLSNPPSPPYQEGLPAEVLLPVPFSPQSPYALWDERDKESCEEASLVMVHYFWQKKKLTAEAMRQELDKMIAFEVQYYGDYKDSDAQGIAEIARKYYGYQNVKVEYEISVEDIKKEIAAGNPVIIPAAGRLLSNPYFTPPGPLYHNLVLAGYNTKGFIANDPGTRRGEKYFYSYNILHNSIHDFPGSKERIMEGRKAMVVVSP